MSAGRRNRLITIQRPLVTVSATGSTTEAWETYVTLWAEMKDRTTTGVENEHAGSTLSIRRVDWVIRQTAGITSSMRILYDNVVWDILAINSLSYDRNRMQIVTEQRGQITDADLVTCPTMCEQIALADAQDIVDCLSAEQEDAIEAIICPISQDATFTLNSTEVGTAAGGDTLNVQVLQGGNPVGSLVNDDWIVPACEDATYSNGGAFTQAIASGATYTAPQITITDVDGSTRSSLPNIGVVCEWKTVNVRSSDGVQVTSIVSYPAGGNYDVLTLRYANKNGSIFATIPHRSFIRLTNANFASVVNDSPNSNQANLTIDVDVPLVNSNGDSVGSNITDLFNPAEVDDVNLTDDNGAVGSYPMPTTIVFDGEVDSASYASGTLTIVPTAGVTPSGIAYLDLTPATTLVDGSASGLDTVALWQSGSYTITNPANPAVFARLDPTDAARTTLINDNFFGNKYRYTDTVGNPSSVGTSVPSRIDWLNHNWSGAVSYIVIDHLCKAMYWVQYLDNAGKIDISTTATGDTWYNWLTYIAGVTLGGYTGWLPIMLNTQLPHAAACDAGDTNYKSFFISHSSGNRLQILTGENYTATRFYPFIDSANGSLISSLGTSDASLKAGTSGFRATLTNIFAMRIMTDAEIAALTP
jgi:SPP1 family predicted phage head-tail adaptor